MRFQVIVSETLKGLVRNVPMVLSVVLVTFVSLLFVGSAALLKVQIGDLKDEFYDKVEVSAFMCAANSSSPTCVDGEATQEQIDAIDEVLRGQLANEVDGIYFESKEDMFATFQERYPDGFMGTELTLDDMQASFRIKLTNPENYDVVADVLTGRQGVEVVEDQRKVFDSLFLALDRASMLTGGLAIVMLVAAALLVSMTIRLSAMSRSTESSIMRMVGASNLLIQLPFMLEGIIASVIGAVLAVGGLWLGVKYLITDWLQQSVSWLPYIDVHDVLRIAPLLVGVALLLAAFASAVSIKRYTKV